MEVQKYDGVVEMGRLRRPHGIKGSVLIESYTQEPYALFTFPLWSNKELSQTIVIRPLATLKENLWIAHIEGFSTRESAKALGQCTLWTKRSLLLAIDSALEQDTYYHADLVGLEVHTTLGEPLGIVSYLTSFGAGDLLYVEGSDGLSFYVLFHKDTVLSVDLSQKRIIIAPHAIP